MSTKTLGENRVRVDFNVTGSNKVDILKKDTAEKMRLIALAQTAYEEACMWAVKAATI